MNLIRDKAETTQGGVDRLTLNYDYGTTTNNGNLRTQTITVPTIGGATGFTATQTYGYDSLNRLSSAQENNGSSWTQNFSYDRYGNRNFVAGTTLPAQLTPSNNPAINTGNNHLDLSVSGQTNVTYDPAGNLTHDINGHAYVYNGENRQTTYEGGASANGGATYYYDGDGRRVKKVVGGSLMASTVFVYNIQGQMVAEYSDAQTSSVGGTSYLTEDTLGTPRVDTDASGNVRARHDYQPFGEELYAGTGARTPQNSYAEDNINQKFTLKERDIETGLDYFKARYYSSAQGRFTSADSFGGSKLNPQSLNRYTYVRNNPLAYTDPLGHTPEPWRINPLEYLFGRRVSEPMMGQDPSKPQDPNKPSLPPAIAPAGIASIPEGTVGIPTVTEFQPIPPPKSFWQRVKTFFGFGSSAAAGISTWGRPETLQEHFEHHGSEFGARTTEEYAQQAQELFVRAAEGGAKMKIGPDGVIRVYEAETNTFAAYNMNGTTRTMFKPNGEDFYFLRQPGRSPWFPRGAEPEVEPEVEPEIPIEIPPIP